MRNAYIDNNEFETTLKAYLSEINPLGSERIQSARSAGRVTSAAVYAKLCDPCYNASAMDGIAVKTEDTVGASELNPVTLKKGSFEYVNTGGVIRPPFDSVIMIENVIVRGDDVEITAPSHPWQHVRAIGETVVATEMIIPSGRKIRPVDIGAILASGNDEISVFRKPKGGIIPTGDEMVENPSEVKEGKLIESNSRVFAALIEEYGGIAQRYAIVKDDEKRLRDAVKKAVAENDFVIVNAGSSAGTKDFTARVIGEEGEVFAHGLAIKPGKPTVLGIIDGKPVIGVPGYPVSAYIVMDKVVKAVVEKLTGLSHSERPKIEAVLTNRIVSSLKSEEFVRVAMGYVDGGYFATPLERGAAAVMSMVKADGLLTIDRNSEGAEQGEKVPVELLRDESGIRRNLVISGSHDVVIDVIGNAMDVVSSHTGSMGGILAMKSGAAHIAPIHLLDAESGEYNVPFVKKYFGSGTMAIIRGLKRTQGFFVRKGELPDCSVDSLKEGKLVFANRQNGSGTRVLFDYLLKKANIDKRVIPGYDKEYTTHLAVAGAVKNKNADCGLGVFSAASIMGLDFIPVAEERYDFLVRRNMLDDERVREFIGILKSDYFKNEVLKLGGYSTEGTGDTEII